MNPCYVSHVTNCITGLHISKGFVVTGIEAMTVFKTVDHCATHHYVKITWRFPNISGQIGMVIIDASVESTPTTMPLESLETSQADSA
jgi:hypothetical protein